MRLTSRCAMRWAGLVLLLFSLVPIRGQVSSGTISGTVRDGTGAVLPGVTITVSNVETGVKRILVTDDTGGYRAPELAAGSYEVQAELAGFQTTVRSGIQMTVGREAIVNVTLEVGEITERVEVTGEAPLVNTTSATLGELVEQKQINELPLNTRDLTQLSLLNPGVTLVRSAPSGNVNSGTADLKVSIGGARIQMTGFLLDGTEIMDTRAKSVGGAAGALFGVETIREFQVLTNNFSAQYGRFAGGIISLVTKSGTNDLHGSLFEFHRNDNLDARNFFDPGDPPEFKRNQFGATIGGPIRKNRTFFFGSYEGFRESLGLTLIATVPTAEVRQGILPGGRAITVNPAVKPFLDLYPLPSPGGRDFGRGGAEYLVARTRPTRDDYWMIKIDHSISDSHSVLGRYTMDDSNRTLPAALPASGNRLSARNQYFTLEDIKVFSSNLVNTARFGFNRSRTTQLFPADQPGLSISLRLNEPFGSIQPGSGISNMGISSWGFGAQNTFQYSDDLQLTRQNHNLKLGVMATRYHNNDHQDFATMGQYAFGNLENFLLGRPVTYVGVLPGPSSLRGFRQTVWGMYVEDGMRLWPNFTLNLGVRYEFTTTPKEVNGLEANVRHPLQDGDTTVGYPFFRNPSYKNFAPRAGLAWDPWGDGKTSVRSGFGLFHDTMLFYQYVLPTRTLPPFHERITIDGPTFPRPVVGPNFRAERTIRPFEFEPHQPYMMQWNLAVQREALAGTTFTVAYVGSRGVNLLGRRNVNIAVPAILPDGRKFFAPGLPRRNPNWDDMELFSYSYNSFYHSLQMGARKRYNVGLALQGAYTWSRCVDDMTQIIGGDFSGQGAQPQDAYDLKGSRGLCNHHVGQAFSFNYIYQLPSSGLSGAAQKLFGGWQTNGIVSLSSGVPLQIQLGSIVDRDRDRNRSEERPNLRAGASNSPVLGGPDLYFDPRAFDLQAPGFYGNLGRNTLIGPGVAIFDFSLVKNTPFADGKNLQFRAELFNVLNRPNLGPPATSIFADANGTLVNGVGRIRNTSTTSRQIQLGMKFTF